MTKFFRWIPAVLICLSLALGFSTLTGCSGGSEKKDKGDKMSGDKMGGDKMGGDKMGGDKMGGDKMGDK